MEPRGTASTTRHRSAARDGGGPYRTNARRSFRPQVHAGPYVLPVQCGTLRLRNGTAPPAVWLGSARVEERRNVPSPWRGSRLMSLGLVAYTSGIKPTTWAPECREAWSASRHSLLARNRAPAGPRVGAGPLGGLDGGIASQRRGGASMSPVRSCRFQRRQHAAGVDRARVGLRRRAPRGAARAPPGSRANWRSWATGGTSPLACSASSARSGPTSPTMRRPWWRSPAATRR